MSNGTLNKGSLVKNLTGSSSGGGGGTTNTLYDLTTSEATKNWCTINGSSRVDLDKADVPTLYADILDKYNNADSELGELTYAADVQYPQIYHNGYYYFTGTTEETFKNIYKSANADLSNSTLFVDFSTKTTFISYGACRIFKNKNYILIINYTTLSPYNINAILYNTNLEYLGSFNGNLPYESYFNDFATGILDDNYLYATNSNELTNTALYRYNIIDCIINNATFEGKAISLSGRKTYFYDEDTSTLYITRSASGGTQYLYTANFDNETATEIKSFSTTGNVKPAWLTKYNGQLIFLQSNYMFKLQSNNTWTEESFNYGYEGNNCFESVEKINDEYYISVSSYYSSTRYDGLKVLKTSDFSTFTTVVSASLSYAEKSILAITADVFLCTYRTVNKKGYYFYSALTKKAYTDTYTINSTETAINYYKSGNWKICVPDTTNDANLATVYTALGELPYFRLDTTGETVSPIRSKMYSAMYVGDEYEEA